MGTTVIPRTDIQTWAFHAYVTADDSRTVILSLEVPSPKGHLPMSIMERLSRLRAALDPNPNLPMYVEGEDGTAVEIEAFLIQQASDYQVTDAMWAFTTESGARISGFITNNI